MKVYIGTEDEILNCGYYTASDDKKYIEELLNELKSQNTWQIINYSYWKLLFASITALKRSYTPKEFKKIAVVSPHHSDDNDFGSIVTKNGDIINSKFNHNDTIFRGYFKSKDHLEQVSSLLPGNDIKFIVTNHRNLTKLDPNIVQPGLYITNVYSENRMHSIKDYSIDVWKGVGVGINRVFSNLGAKKITIKDTTSNELKGSLAISEKLLKKLSLELGFNFNRKEKFDLSFELEPAFNKEKAGLHLELLRPADQLYQLASYIIDDGRITSIKQNIDIDISFGLNINALTLLQGSFEGGNQRKLEVDISF
jgi:hypothetical protein